MGSDLYLLMRITELLPNLLLIEPKVFEDHRGHFFESFREDVLNSYGVDKFVQDNQSISSKGTLRGLHFQHHPHAQGKLVRVIKGSVLDVAVDIRKDSPTYGHHFTIELSEINNTMFYIPPGFAHGFVVTSESAEFLYKTTDYWHPEHERSLLWSDPDLAIAWPALPQAPLLATKDASAPTWAQTQADWG